MPENATYNFSYENRLYLLVSGASGTTPSLITGPAVFDTDLPGGLNTLPGGTELVLFDKIRSLTVNSDSTTSDITTRDEARDGFRVEVDVLRANNMTFQVRYQRAWTATNGTVNDIRDEQALIRSLLLAQINNTGIGGVDFDGGTDSGVSAFDDANSINIGTIGLAGNWSVNFNNTKEIDGVVFSDMTLRLATRPKWVEWTGAAFEALDSANVV